MKLHVLGIDLGKTVFHLVGMDSTGMYAVGVHARRIIDRELKRLAPEPALPAGADHPEAKHR
jgi:hypothetical protein